MPFIDLGDFLIAKVLAGRKDLDVRRACGVFMHRRLTPSAYDGPFD